MVTRDRCFKQLAGLRLHPKRSQLNRRTQHGFVRKCLRTCAPRQRPWPSRTIRRSLGPLAGPRRSFNRTRLQFALHRRLFRRWECLPKMPSGIRINQNLFLQRVRQTGVGPVQILTTFGANRFNGGSYLNFGGSIWNSRNPYAAYMIQHGIRLSGMPAWNHLRSSQEIWDGNSLSQSDEQAPFRRFRSSGERRQLPRWAVENRDFVTQSAVGIDRSDGDAMLHEAMRHVCDHGVLPLMSTPQAPLHDRCCPVSVVTHNLWIKDALMRMLRSCLDRACLCKMTIL